MDKFTFESDEHGTFTADAERVTEMLNFWNFRCGSQPYNFALIQEDYVKWTGQDGLSHIYNDVCNRFAFAIMFVDADMDQAYMADKTLEIRNLLAPFAN